METSKFKQEIMLAVGLFIVLFLLYNPFSMSMPGGFEMTLIILLLVFYAAFAIFFWREKHQDERESLLKLYSDRVAFRLGGAVLAAGIFVQGLEQNIDNWLVVSLAAIVAGKILGQILGRKNY